MLGIIAIRLAFCQRRAVSGTHFRKTTNLDDNGGMDEIENPNTPPAATAATHERVQDAPPSPPPTPSAPSFDPRRRLRELLSVPEGQRTDPQWDEIIEHEVQLAPGNRIGGDMPRNNDRNDRGQGQKNAGSGGAGGNPGAGGNWKRGPGSRKHSKPSGRKPGPTGAA